MLENGIKDKEREVLDLFGSDEFAALLGIKIISVSSEKAVGELIIEKKHLNADGVVQGGVIFTIADLIFCVLANYNHGHTVTQNCSVTYSKPVTGSVLTAEAAEITFSKRNVNGQVIIRDDSGIVAVATINGFIK